MGDRVEYVVADVLEMTEKQEPWGADIVLMELGVSVAVQMFKCSNVQMKVWEGGALCWSWSSDQEAAAWGADIVLMELGVSFSTCGHCAAASHAL